MRPHRHVVGSRERTWPSTCRPGLDLAGRAPSRRLTWKGREASEFSAPGVLLSVCDLGGGASLLKASLLLTQSLSTFLPIQVISPAALQPSPGHPRHRPGFHASSSRSCSLLAPPLSLPGWLSPQRVAYTTLLSAGPAPCLSCQSAASSTGPSALPDATGRKHLLPSLSFGAIKHGRFIVSS